MKIRARHFPHPVLAYFSDDFVNSSLDTEVTPIVKDGKYYFDVKCKLDDNELKELISNIHASYAVHIECNKTRYRNVFKGFTEEFDFYVPAEKLDGRVEICSLILAETEITEYYNNNFHPDFGSIVFKLSKGDILAVAEEKIFEAEKEIDPLQKVSSIFSVQRNTMNSSPPPIDYELNYEKVIIFLSPENFDNYKILKQNQNLHSTLASMFVLPVLSILIEELKHNSEEAAAEYNSKRWFKVLEKKLDDIGVKIDDPNTYYDHSLVIAQTLIGNQLSYSLEALIGFEEEEEFY